MKRFQWQPPTVLGKVARTGKKYIFVRLRSFQNPIGLMFAVEKSIVSFWHAAYKAMSRPLFP
jgi:hypothetical protein